PGLSRRSARPRRTAKRTQRRQPPGGSRNGCSCVDADHYDTQSTELQGNWTSRQSLTQQVICHDQSQESALIEGIERLLVYESRSLVSYNARRRSGPAS